MYELGLAHAMDKETVVLWRSDWPRDDSQKTPFDVNHYTLTYYTEDTLHQQVSAILESVFGDSMLYQLNQRGV